MSRRCSFSTSRLRASILWRATGFWELLIDLSRNQGVTIFVSTHFMNEAERCDRISLMDSGHVLATDTPANLVSARGVSTLEDAFISYLEEATGARAAEAAAFAAPSAKTVEPPRLPPPRQRAFSLQRLFAYTIRETIELLRDPIRLTFALLGTALLMVVFGYGISTDVNNLTFAVLDHDKSHESRAYLEELRGSTYFVEKPPLADYSDLRESVCRADASGLVLKSRPGSVATSSAGVRLGWRLGWMAPCHSAPTPSAAICRPCISSILPIRR